MQIKKLSPNLGAAMSGVDLSQPITPELASTLRETVAVHRILVVKNQKLDAQAQQAFSECFGETLAPVTRRPDGIRMPQAHEITNATKDGDISNDQFLGATAYWHTDGAYFAVPPIYTILHAVKLPSSGGDTEFVDMRAAYEALPESQKRELEGVQVVHSHGEKNLVSGGRAGTMDELREAPPVIHPLIKRVDGTDQRALYLGMYAVRIPGMPDEEARAFLAKLHEHSIKPQFRYTHVWEPGDLLMWDNRTLMHRAVGNFDMDKEVRTLRRTVVKNLSYATA